MSTMAEKTAPSPEASVQQQGSPIGDITHDSTLNEPQGTAKKGFRFWAIIASLLVATFLSALDLTAAATALPTIASSLQATDYTFIGTAYSIASAAIIPWAGGLANCFGRRPAMLLGLAFFLLGSILCGEATDMNMMLAGRSFQGVGSGIILTLTEIILADLVSLADRGGYQGAFGAIWALASATGPLIGAGTAQTDWRWLFRMNYPATVVIAAIVAAFIKLKSPPGTFKEKISQMDWLGNAVFIPSISLFVIGLTWGGQEHPWVSAHVLAPLIIGIIGLIVWVLVEAFVVKYPNIPFREMNNRTTWIGFFTTFMQGISALALFYYWPTWFQAAKGSSPVRSAIQFFPVAFCVAPFAMVAGGSISATGSYYWQNVIAWVFMTVGPGLLTLVHADAGTKLWASLPIPFSIGIGLLYAATVFPVLSPLPPQLAGHALAFLTFARSFGNILGVTVGSVTLANELSSRLPAEYIATLPGGVAGAYASIPAIRALAEPLRSEVEAAFGESIRVIWLVLIPFGGIGLVATCFMKQIDLHVTTDENWGLKDGKVEGEGKEERLA